MDVDYKELQNLLGRCSQALKASETRFHKMIEESADGVIIVDGEGIVRFVNPAAELLFGRKSEQFVGELFGFPVISGETKEIQIIAGYNEVRFAEMRVVETEWEGDIAYLVSIRDITNRKHAEEKIKRDYHIQSTINSILQISLEPVSLEEQLERILDLILTIPWLSIQSKGCIFLIEDDPTVLVMKRSRRFSEIHQATCGKVPSGKCLCGQALSTGEIIFTDRIDDRHEVSYEGIVPHGHYCVPILSGNRVLGVINLYVKEGHMQDKEEENFLSLVANTLAGIIERQKMEEELKKTKGELELRVKERTSELAMTVELLEREIAERKKVEEELAREHRLMQTLLDNIPDSIYFKDKRNRFVKVSKSNAEHSKTTVEKMIGKTDFDFLPKNQAKEAFEDDKKVMRSGKLIKDKIETLTRKNGTENWVSVTKIPWYDEKGTAVGTIGISRNITERKKAEEDLNREREKFISVLIHDLKGPIIPVSGYLKRLIEGKAKSEEDRLRILKIIQKASQELLQNIEHTSKDLRGKSVLQFFHPEEIIFTDMLISSIMNSIPVMEDRGIEILINNKRKESWNNLEKIALKADPSQLKTLIENLLENAIKYAKSEINVELSKTGAYIRFVVSDDVLEYPSNIMKRSLRNTFRFPEVKREQG